MKTIEISEDRIQMILDKIAELSKEKVSQQEADSILSTYFVVCLPDEIYQAYKKMISDMIPF